jgi:hypothetical protein
MGMDDEERRAYEATLVEGYRSNVTRVDIPARDSQGNYLSLTLDWLFAWASPYQSVVHLMEGNLGKSVAAAIGFGNPLLATGVGVASGMDSFSGQRLYDEAATDGEKVAASVNHALNNLILPPPLVGSLEPVFELFGYQVRSPYQGWVSMAADKVVGNGISNSGKYIGDWGPIMARSMGFNVVNHDPARRSQSEYRIDQMNIRNIDRQMSAIRRNAARTIQEIERIPGISREEMDRRIEREIETAESQIEALQARRLEAVREQGAGIEERSAVPE